MSSNENDLQVIQRILQGDKPAFRLLYGKYVRLYMLIIRRYFNKQEDAEDLVQEAFIKIYRDLHQFDGKKGQFKHWSKRVVINTCLQKLRKKTVLQHFEDITESNYEIGVSPEVVSKLNLEELTKIIHKLSPGRRIVFNLYIIDGYTHKEISEMLGISVSTSKTQLMRAKKMLQLDISNNKISNESYAGK